MTSIEGENSSDEIVTTKCCVCAGRNITREAEKYCIECQDYYCIPCTDTHKTFPMMKGHTLMDRRDFNSTYKTSQPIPGLLLEKCPIHSSMELDMYCQNHDNVLCQVCKETDHRFCIGIQNVSIEVEDLFQGAAFKDTVEKLTNMQGYLAAVMADKEELHKQQKKQKLEVIRSIRSFVKKIQATIERLGEKSIEEVEAAFKKMKNKFEREWARLKHNKDELNSYVKKMHNSAGCMAQQFVCMKLASKETEHLAKSTEHLDQPDGDTISFTLDKRLQTTLQELKTLGKVSRVYKSHRSTAREVKQEEIQASVEGQNKLENDAKVYQDQKPTAREVISEKVINIKSGDDKSNCQVYGSCFTEDNTLLLTDEQNKKLKRLDVSKELVTDSVKLNAGPYAVCLTNQNEAVVSLNNNTIQFVSLGDRMTTTRNFQADHNCFGIAFKDGKLFITDEGTGLYIYNEAGKMLKSITTDKSGNAIFNYTKHVCLGTIPDRVYVVDYFEGFVTLDTKGNYLSTVKVTDELFGVCADGRSSIFVFSWASQNIVQIDKENQTTLCTFKTELRPTSASFDPKSKQLAVTGSNSNIIKIYNLQ